MIFHEALAESLRRGASAYAASLAEAGDAVLSLSPGGVARNAYDFTYEALLLNEDTAVWFRSGVMPLYDTESGYPVCPPDLRNPAALGEALLAATDEVIRTMADQPEEKWKVEVELDAGFLIPGFGLVIHVIDHMAYHHGQLVQVMCLAGQPPP